MTSALQPFDRSTRQKSRWLGTYGLLLVLALFLAGQVASSAHWHDVAAANQLDADCALCMLSSANGAAAIGAGWQLPFVPCNVLLAVVFLPMVRRAVVRFHDSRAPPAIL